MLVVVLEAGRRRGGDGGSAIAIAGALTPPAPDKQCRDDPPVPTSPGHGEAPCSGGLHRLHNGRCDLLLQRARAGDTGGCDRNQGGVRACECATRPGGLARMAHPAAVLHAADALLLQRGAVLCLHLHGSDDAAAEWHARHQSPVARRIAGARARVRVRLGAAPLHHRRALVDVCAGAARAAGTPLPASPRACSHVCRHLFGRLAAHLLQRAHHHIRRLRRDGPPLLRASPPADGLLRPARTPARPDRDRLLGPRAGVCDSGNTRADPRAARGAPLGLGARDAGRASPWLRAGLTAAGDV
mmetsp:Transcript_17650/g.56445  ORF Transcript_17650/g.56445 Transcript_17650/m.56445 type:complete len:300 (+) Transcript_17650:113-1012(+)